MKNAKRKVGRPKVITTQIEERLLTLVMEGNTVTSACGKLKINYSTVARKEAEGGNFASLLARARVAGAAWCLDEAEDKLRKATSRTIMARRELASHLRWKASKLMPLYADRIGIQPIVPPVAPMQDRDLLETARNIGFVLAAAELKAEEMGVTSTLPLINKQGERIDTRAKPAPAAEYQPAPLPSTYDADADQDAAHRLSMQAEEHEIQSGTPTRLPTVFRHRRDRFQP